MNIPAVTTAIKKYPIKLLSGLGDNENSLTAMVIKDWMSDAATVATYKKEGGKDDAKEKCIEEFGTGLVWLFGIPTIKKGIDLTAYKLLKLDPKFDPRLLNNKNAAHFEQLKAAAQGKEKELFETLDDVNPVAKNIFKEGKILSKLTNKNLYKGLAFGKFAIATAASAFFLNKIIKYKQKTTTDRINSEINNKPDNKNDILLKNSINKESTFATFTSKKQSNDIAFKGSLSDFMFNPIQNTKILDGVIAATRLKEARKGERPEIVFKELCNWVVVYKLAKPVQKGFEALGDKIKCPIELDPQVLFTKGIIEKIDKSKDQIKALSESEDVVKDVLSLGAKNPVVKMLADNNALSLTKNGDAISCLKPIDPEEIMKTLKNLIKLNDAPSLNKVKTYKVFALIANVLITAGIMGVAQPLLSILLRKTMNNGDNRNPAIVAQEKNAASNYAK